MRPLAVLALVLAALAALFFAYFSLSGDSGPRGEAVSAVARPKVEPEARKTADVAAAPAVVEEARTELQAVDPVQEPSGGAWQNLLYGTVVGGSASLPVQNARVSVFRRRAPENLAALTAMFNPTEANAKPVRVVRTSEVGRYEIKGLPPGNEYVIVVEHESYQRTDRGPITIQEEGEVREDLSLSEGILLLGYVRDQTTGLPIAGASLWIDNPLAAQLPSDRASPDRITATSAADGRYEFQHLVAGTKWLVCSAEGYGTVMIPNLNIGGEDQPSHEPKDINMRPEVTIAGRVVGPDRRGIPGATIDAVSYNAETLSRGNAVSGPEGAFVIRGLAEADYSVVARADGFGEKREVRVTAGTQTLELELSELGGVMGRVVDQSSGKALSNFKVSARMVNQTATFVGRVASEQNVRGADNGAFHLKGLSPGTFVVQVSAEGFADTRSDVFTVAQGLTVPDVLVRMSRGGGLTGLVVDGYTNQPVAGAVVATQDNNWVDSPFTNALGALVTRTTTDAVARTNKEGRFEFELLTPETYQVNARHGDYTTYSANDVQVFEGQTRDLGTIKLFKGSKVTGQVFLGNGGRAIGATVSLHPATPGIGVRSYDARTNSEGRYTFTAVAPGEYKLSAARQAQEANPFGIVIDMKQSEVAISLIDQREYTQDLYLGE